MSTPDDEKDVGSEFRKTETTEGGSTTREDFAGEGAISY